MGTIDKINGIPHNFPLEIEPTTLVNEKEKSVLSGAEEVRLLYTLLQLYHSLQLAKATVLKNNDEITNKLLRLS